MRLHAVSVEYSRRGIKVSPYVRTTNPAIFAAGDCAASGPNPTRFQSTKAGSPERLCWPARTRAVAYPPISSAVFTLPQVATVGPSEAAARDKGLEFETHFDKTNGWHSSMRVKPVLSTGPNKIKSKSAPRSVEYS